MRVSAISGKSIISKPFTAQQNKQTERTPRIKEFVKKNKTYLEAGAAAIVIGSALYAYHGKCKYTNVINTALSNTKKIKLLKKQLRLFPKDIEYRKNLMRGIGCKESGYVYLRPIVGPQEYKSIIKDFSDSPVHYSPGGSLITEQKDGFNMSGKINGTYRANLHIHTNTSDGRMSVAELLDQSAQYADDIAAKIHTNKDIKAPYAPFTIAITDHDTLEGCKEAVKIINANPEKYRNLRVVLGCELSVENSLMQCELNKPVSTHMLLHGINPFDKTLNNYLDSKKLSRANMVKDIIKASSQKLSHQYPDTAANLSYEEAKSSFLTINKSILHVDYHARDYVFSKVLFSELLKNNPQINKIAAEKDINLNNLNYTYEVHKYLKGLPYQIGGGEWNRILTKLHEYTANLLGISKEEAASKMPLPENLEKIFSEISIISNDARPRLVNLQSAYIDMKEFIDIFKKQKYGYMSIAHPGLMDVGHALKYPEHSSYAILDIFKNFKTYGGDKALCAELYYHYFGVVGKSKNWLNIINQYARTSALMPSGGLDNHGKSIFYSGT